MKIEKCAKPISLRCSRYRARQSKIIAVYNSVRNIASSLNYVYDEGIGYECALVTVSAEKSTVPVVQDSAAEYRRERSQNECHQGFLKPC